MIDDDLTTINVALNLLDPELALIWREVHGHAHDGSGPIGQGKSFRELGTDRGVPHATIRDRYRTADREVCAHFARHLRRAIGVTGIADHILETPRRYHERRSHA